MGALLLRCGFIAAGPLRCCYLFWVVLKLRVSTRIVPNKRAVKSDGTGSDVLMKSASVTRLQVCEFELGRGWV
jgi:hypothetical protein